MHNTFKAEQLKQERVRLAHEEKSTYIQNLLKEYGLQSSSLELYMRVFKLENQLEVWAKDDRQKEFQLLKTYIICFASGNMGPKNKQGDYQVPEGFYHIERYNPWSKYHLSLGINYPNKADKLRARANTSLGGDIFIHGRCSSVGCLAMNDEQIKELYLLAIEARGNGQKHIPVHIFPLCMDEQKLELLKETARNNPSLLNFWKSLQPAYTHFEHTKQLPYMHTSATGEYTPEQ